MKTIHFDYLVIGSGIAGLTYALKLALRHKEAKICIVTKDVLSESNTKYAQGGVATVWNTPDDSYEQHITDTLIAGDGLCDADAVNVVVKEARERIKELIGWGVEFDKNHLGDFDLGLEGGHSQNRILHHKDSTGLEIETKLVKQVRLQPNITLFEHHLAVDLIHSRAFESNADSPNSCYGAYVLNTKTETVRAFTANITLLATGGVGQVYKNTTNPIVATGDGIAMAHRIGAKIRGMEYIQFHPTALKYGHQSPHFLISEAVRGFGAYLVNADGNRFMQSYDPRLELAPRDIVSRAIHAEMQKNNTECVYLDCRHLDAKEFEMTFTSICSKLKSLNIDISKDLIPVAPAAHYLCGGIETNLRGETSVRNLLACGECAYTGLHGANRLASNSLIEAAVFAHRCFLTASKNFGKIKPVYPRIAQYKVQSKPSAQLLADLSSLWKEIQSKMQACVSILRKDSELAEVLLRLEEINQTIISMEVEHGVNRDTLELKNLTTVATLIVSQSLKQQENKGVFYKLAKIKKESFTENQVITNFN